MAKPTGPSAQENVVETLVGFPVAYDAEKGPPGETGQSDADAFIELEALSAEKEHPQGACERGLEGDRDGDQPASSHPVGTIVHDGDSSESI
jgi:hypothetical protein